LEAVPLILLTINDRIVHSAFADEVVHAIAGLDLCAPERLGPLLPSARAEAAGWTAIAGSDPAAFDLPAFFDSLAPPAGLIRPRPDTERTCVARDRRRFRGDGRHPAAGLA